MEPARKKVEFVGVDGRVVVTKGDKVLVADLYSLGGELFADIYDKYYQLFKDGFTSGPWRWEHFTDLAINIRCNSLGRMVCQN